MSLKVIAVVAFAWVLSLAGVAAWAQNQSRIVPWGSPVGDVLTAENVGFQRIADPASGKDGKVIGKWLVKIDGKWVETQAPIGVVRGGSEDK